MGLYEEIGKEKTQEKRIRKGLGLPGPKRMHQKVCLEIAMVLYNSIDESRYDVYPDTELDGPNSRSPDITIWELDDNGEAQKPRLIVEVVRDYRQGIKYTYNVIMEIYDQFPDLQEVYMYNYETDTWYEVHRDGEVYEGDCFSELLGIRMDVTLVKYKQKMRR